MADPISAGIGAVGAIAGGLLGGSSGSQQSGTATSTSTSNPWAPSVPYLNQIQGAAQTNYNNEQYTPQMANTTSNFLNNSQSTNPQQLSGANQFVNNVLGGNYNTNLGTVGAVNPTQSFSSFGVNDPTQANAQLLSGQVNNPYLQQMQQASTNQAMQTYNQGLQSAMQTIEPQIQSGAIGAGQYGGSRQGIAEGIMGQQELINAQNLGQSSLAAGANLYGNAYQNAQNNMATTANNLTNQSLNNGQFNANLGLQNNSQQMAQQQNNISNGLQGINAASAANTLAGNQYSQQMQYLNAPNTYANQQLSNYSNLINPTAGMGGSQVSTQPIYSNPVGSAIGGGLLGLGLGNAYGRTANTNASGGLNTANILNGSVGTGGFTPTAGNSFNLE
jgi:hypothetical protein